jgi:hypothetical protein
LAEQGLKATGASNDKRALVPESAPEVAASLERRIAAVKSVGGHVRQKRPETIENPSPLPSKDSTMHRRAMLILHAYSRIDNRLLTISAFECRLWRQRPCRMVNAMQFSRLFLHRTIDFCSAAI